MSGSPDDGVEGSGTHAVQRIADGAFSRGTAVKALAAALLGGLARLVAAPVPDVEAGKRRQLTTLWAVVNNDATLRIGKGVKSVGRFHPTGSFAVTFNRDVSECTYVATPTDQIMGLTNASNFFGDGVLVITGTAANTFTPADIPFNLAVQC
jgi:hypothetical protein